MSDQHVAKDNRQTSIFSPTKSTSAHFGVTILGWESFLSGSFTKRRAIMSSERLFRGTGACVMRDGAQRKHHP